MRAAVPGGEAAGRGRSSTGAGVCGAGRSVRAPCDSHVGCVAAAGLARAAPLKPTTTGSREPVVTLSGILRASCETRPLMKIQ